MVSRSIGARKRNWSWIPQKAQRLKYSSTRYIKNHFLHFKKHKTTVRESSSKCRWIQAGSRGVIEKVITLKIYVNAGPLKSLPEEVSSSKNLPSSFPKEHP